MEENEDRLGEEEVVLMMMSRMVVRVNVNVNRMRLREEVSIYYVRETERGMMALDRLIM